MKFVCDRCNTRYSISDEKVRGKVLKIRCKTCGGVVTVSGEHLDAPPPPDPDRTVLAPMPIPESAFREPAEPPPPPPGERTVLAPMPVPSEAIPTPTPRVAAREWHISVDGKTKGPFDIDRVIEEIAALEPTTEVHLWNEELDTWKPVTQVSGVWRLVQHKRRIMAAPARKPRPLARPSAVPPPIPGAARRDSAARPAVKKRSITPGNEALLKPVSGVIAASDSSSDATPAPVAAGPKVVPAPDLGARRISGARTVAATSTGQHSAVTPLPARVPDALGAAGASSSLPPGAATPVVGAPVAHAAVPAGFGGPQPAANGLISQALAIASAPVPIAPEVTPSYPAPVPPDGGSGLLPKSRLELVRRQRMLKYIIALLLVVVVVCVVVAWHAVQRGGQVRTVVIEKEKAAERKLSPDELAERLGMVDTPTKTTTVNVGGKTDSRTTAPPRASNGKTVPAGNGKPASTGKSQPALDQQAAQRFAEPEGVRLPAGGISAPTRATGAVSQDAISRVLNANKGGIKACYQRALLRDSSLVSGKIMVRLSIGISGRVKSVTISGPPQFRSVESCVKDVVQRWVFPASADEYGTEFPFVFQGAE